MSHFKPAGDRIAVDLSKEERMFLGDILPMLASIGVQDDDPAADRLTVPVYLDDPEANDEWWRLMGEDLDAARRVDRAVLDKTLAASGQVTLDEEEANALLRVLNEARLTLGARLGIDVEEDHDNLPPESRQALDYLGWIQEELTMELMRRL